MNMEVEIIKYVQSFNNPILDIIFLIITMSTEVPIILIVASILYWCINKNYGERLLFALTTNIALNTGVKEYFKSPRPIGVEGIKSMRTSTATGYSFPSGHTQIGTTFWISIMNILKNKYMYLFGTITFICIGLSRVYLGVHWPIDILFGWFFGLFLTIMCNCIVTKIEDSQKYSYFMIIVIPMILGIIIINSIEYIKMVALLSGFIIGYIIEKQCINFKVDVSLKSKVCRYIFGLFSLAFIYAILKLIMPKNYVGSYLRYFILMIYAMAGAPYVFSKIWKE